jgi:hypothetical protein
MIVNSNLIQPTPIQIQNAAASGCDLSRWKFSIMTENRADKHGNRLATKGSIAVWIRTEKCGVIVGIDGREVHGDWHEATTASKHSSEAVQAFVNRITWEPMDIVSLLEMCFVC